jgi:hypothetical protein
MKNKRGSENLPVYLTENIFEITLQIKVVVLGL